MQTLFIFLALALGSADVYRWVDADGQAHYTDRPQSGAERITIDVSSPASSPGSGSPNASTKARDEVPPAAFAGYQSLTITRPTQEQVLWNIEGQLDVAAAVQPELQPGHALQFHLDGRTIPAEAGATQARFPEVFRGEHVLRVDVVDASQRTLISSPTLRFFVRQTSIADPAPARLPAQQPVRRP
ncbi:MAG: DUF4124 domain-containing protein [Gammaproteobacteria bacterium]|nr:DUF4124 domain-containing protein [Gammaproteobacteria bacterium]